MKVKVLTTNIMVDYKKVEKGQVIDLSKDAAERFIKAELVESIVEPAKEKSEPIIVIVDEKEFNLANKSGKTLAEFAAQYKLEEQRKGETVREFAERLKAEYEASLTKE